MDWLLVLYGPEGRGQRRGLSTSTAHPSRPDDRSVFFRLGAAGHLGSTQSHLNGRSKPQGGIWVCRWLLLDAVLRGGLSRVVLRPQPWRQMCPSPKPRATACCPLASGRCGHSFYTWLPAGQETSFPSRTRGKVTGPLTQTAPFPVPCSSVLGTAPLVVWGVVPKSGQVCGGAEICQAGSPLPFRDPQTCEPQGPGGVLSPGAGAGCGGRVLLGTLDSHGFPSQKYFL